MSLAQFSLNVWAYCVKSKPAIAEFVFDLFDDDGSKYLNDKEVQTFVVSVYGAKGANIQTKMLLDKIDKNKDKVITKKEFVAGTLKLISLSLVVLIS